MWVWIAARALVLILGSWVVDAARPASMNKNVARRSPEAFGRARPDVEENDRAGLEIDEQEVPVSGFRTGVSSTGRA
ncbi:hypothetical protein QOZ88_12100 [Blastococcus sp. BMG 814]|uniref:Secreted protein n=1 Tax=Blastococcus carthaginiensis TaxID=3050034 RepID=A0ABT9ICS9_9ACTN|nr:hypothetical protein [Blastococcus carthaginiensis]MDP5183383.1 hypothetical protein [Blastococcus carthaginiensis]